MGADNLFHKNRAKKTEQLARQKDKRQPYARVLIVCEGTKTEPNYFNALARQLKLSSANIKVVGKGSDPLLIVGAAVKFYEEEKDKGNPFDRVFCVFDKDTHKNYQEALDQLKKLGDIFVAINSVPCFEYWLLLHFKCTDAPFAKAGKRSVGDAVVLALRKYIKDYKKGGTDFIDDLLAKRTQAVINAKAVLKSAIKSNTDNPSTHVHELVEYLESLKAR